MCLRSCGSLGISDVGCEHAWGKPSDPVLVRRNTNEAIAAGAHQRTDKRSPLEAERFTKGLRPLHRLQLCMGNIRN